MSNWREVEMAMERVREKIQLVTQGTEQLKIDVYQLEQLIEEISYQPKRRIARQAQAHFEAMGTGST